MNYFTKTRLEFTTGQKNTHRIMSIGNGEAKPLYHELRLHDLIFAIFLWDGDDQIDQLVAKKFRLVFAVHGAILPEGWLVVNTDRFYEITESFFGMQLGKVLQKVHDVRLSVCLARRERFELPTYWIEANCSNSTELTTQVWWKLQGSNL